MISKRHVAGSGQAAEELAKRYARVIAQDASPAQLAAAGSLSSAVQFQQAMAEATGLPDASVDLVTVAQALHWWDSNFICQPAASRITLSSCSQLHWCEDGWTWTMAYHMRQHIMEQLRSAVHTL